jgi:2-iminobutanoate/2-iminopropanoate deaminase
MRARLCAIALLVTAVAVPAHAQRRVIRPEGAPTDRPYSPGIQVGQTLYISGQLGLPGAGATPATMDAQARQAMDGIGAVLKAAGLGYEHLVKCQVYLASMDDYAAMNAAYQSYFKGRVPARTTIQAAALPSKAGVEIGCIAYADVAAISVVTPPAGTLPAPLGPYSPAVWAGDTLYISGMGGQNPATKAVAEDVPGQVTQTIANISTTLKAASLELRDVVSTQGYLTRLDEVAQYPPAFTAAFAPLPLPARGLVVVPRLPGPIRAELTFVAVRPTVRREPIGDVEKPHAIKAATTLYASPEEAPDEGPTTEAQARAAFEYLRGTLSEASLTMRDVASVTVYLSDVADMPAMNAVFKETFPVDPPARVTVQVQPEGKERIRVALIAAR